MFFQAWWIPSSHLAIPSLSGSELDMLFQAWRQSFHLLSGRGNIASWSNMSCGLTNVGGLISRAKSHSYHPRILLDSFQCCDMKLAVRIPHRNCMHTPDEVFSVTYNLLSYRLDMCRPLEIIRYPHTQIFKSGHFLQDTQQLGCIGKCFLEMTMYLPILSII